VAWLRKTRTSAAVRGSATAPLRRLLILTERTRARVAPHAARSNVPQMVGLADTGGRYDTQTLHAHTASGGRRQAGATHGCRLDFRCLHAAHCPTAHCAAGTAFIAPPLHYALHLTRTLRAPPRTRCISLATPTQRTPARCHTASLVARTHTAERTCFGFAGHAHAHAHLPAYAARLRSAARLHTAHAARTHLPSLRHRPILSGSPRCATPRTHCFRFVAVCVGVAAERCYAGGARFGIRRYSAWVGRVSINKTFARHAVSSTPSRMPLGTVAAATWTRTRTLAHTGAAFAHTRGNGTAPFCAFSMGRLYLPACAEAAVGYRTWAGDG